MNKKFKIVVCPYCREIQAIMATKRFRCRFCGRSTSVSRLKIYYATDDAREAVEMVKAFKEDVVCSKEA